MKKYIHQIFQWICAGIIAVVVCNCLLLIYHRPAGWIERTNSATSAIWRPGSTLLMGTEGRGSYTVDKDGYLNADLPKQDNYVLVLGASYTQGKEVKFGERYTDLLNGMLTESTDKLAVYNCSQDAKFLPGIINDFYAITQEFPDAETIVIETGNTDFSSKELQAACNQHDYDKKQVGSVIMSNMSFMQKAKLLAKESLPLYTVLKSQMTAMAARNDVGGVVDSDSSANVDTEQEQSLMKALALIRSQFDGKLIIMYHPMVSLEGTGELVITEQKTTEMFAAACAANNILFVDMSDAFLTAYEEDYSVPYGFFNTTMATGHLSADGHRVIAEELYKVLKEEE